MTLKAFEFAHVEEGYFYELDRGYIVVSDLPGVAHVRRVDVIRRGLDIYYMANSDRVYEVLGSMECKLLIEEWESERHPDIAVYLTPPAEEKPQMRWRNWYPGLTVEVVSESSRDRDYTEKRDEYWTLGVAEYWIVDAKLEKVLVLKRGRTQWTEKILGRDDFCETKLLPGFKLPCQAIFDAAGTETC